jgi:hypothetical protein
MQAIASHRLEAGKRQIFSLSASWPHEMFCAALLCPPHHDGLTPLKPKAKVNPPSFKLIFSKMMKH